MGWFVIDDAVARGRQYDDYLIFQNFDPKRINSTGHRWRYDKKGDDRSRRPSKAITLLNELAAAGAEREETNSASAYAPRCRHSAARNATACLTSTSNNAFTGFRRTMDHTMDWMCCSCDR